MNTDKHFSPPRAESGASNVVSPAAKAGAKWLVPFSALSDAETLLFCFPYSGAGASVFHGWGPALAPQIGVVGVELPGRDSRYREPLRRSADELATPIAEAISPLLKRPYALLGHSMGAVLAFEVAHRLVERGSPPALLVVSARGGGAGASQSQAIHQLPDPLFIQAIERFGGTPRRCLDDAELREVFLPILRADLAVAETHCFRQRPRLSCPILAIGGQDDRSVSAAQLAAWAGHTSSDFSFRIFPGGHFFIRSVQDRVVSFVAEAIASQMRRTAAGDLRLLSGDP